MLPGGVAPQFEIDLSPADARYRSRGLASSRDEVTSALREAATFRSSFGTPILVCVAIASVLALMIQPWLLLAVWIAGLIVWTGASQNAAQRRRVAVLYRFDRPARQAFESLRNGVRWLANSDRLWSITAEEPAQRPANTLSVSRIGAQSLLMNGAPLLANVDVPCVVAGGEALLFLPDALLVRDAAAQFVDVPYSSIHVHCAATQFSESDAPPVDSNRVASAWLFANKDGSPDRRRANNRQIPVLEYARVTLSWRNSSRVLLASNVQAARHFANAVLAMTELGKPRTVNKPAPAAVPATAPAIQPKPEAKMPLPPTPQPTELERALQASIDRKRREEQLERERQRAAAPRREPTSAAGEWLPDGRSATVHGFATGGFVYFGNRLPSFDGSGTEPALINPALPVDLAHANTTGAGMNYWPSYGGISAASRRAFLEWLAGGRRDPNAYIGYVFIFFYGLERRVYEFLQERGSTADEILAIAHEVARLAGIYAQKSGSFASYANSLLELIATVEPRACELVRPSARSHEFSARLKIALGKLAAAAKPVPAALALEWVRASWSLNTPAVRCERELELLFAIRYAKKFGDGPVMQPGASTIESSYRAASAALPSLTIEQSAIPDVTGDRQMLAQCIELAQECTAALDPLSRFLGKNEDGRGSLAAFALLPVELAEAAPPSSAASLATLVRSHLLDEAGRAHLPARELLQHVQLAKREKVSKSEATLLAQTLEKLGFGVEPDVRLGGPVFDVDGRAVVFRRLPDCPSAASDEYAAATLLIRLGAMVSAADDEVSQTERELLERHIDERLRLTAGDRQRLTAHLAWLLEADLGMTGLKRRLEELPPESRRAVARLLVDVAGSDGRIDAREMKMLEKLYDLLALPAAELYRDVHGLQAQDDEPVVVAPAVDAKGFAIPPQPAPATTAAGIDMERVRLKITETRQVSSLLSSIFVEEEVPAAVAPAIAQAGVIGTLDAAHSELLRRLTERESWPRDEIERLAAGLSLLPDGALETINDYAYAAANEPLWEDDDPVSINPKVARELTA